MDCLNQLAKVVPESKEETKESEGKESATFVEQVETLEKENAKLKEENSALLKQLKEALSGKVDDVKSYLANFGGESAAKIAKLTKENAALLEQVEGLKSKAEGVLKEAAGGVQQLAAAKAAGSLGQAIAAGQGAKDEAKEKATEAGTEALTAGQDMADNAEEKVEEAAEAVTEQLKQIKLPW